MIANPGNTMDETIISNNEQQSVMDRFKNMLRGSPLQSGNKPLHVLSDYIFQIGVFILLLLFSTVTLSTLLFFVNIPVTPLSLFLGLGIAGIIQYFLLNRNPHQVLILMIIGLLLVLACMGLSSVVCDNSFDGNWYHKSAAGLIASGWNPLYETSTEAIERLNLVISESACWSDYYPKATWIFSAAVYALSGAIESGKCYHFLSIIALFCIGYSYLRERMKLKNWQAGLCAFFLAVNPVSIGQLTSYYNDAFLGSMLLIYILTLLYITYENGEIRKYTSGAYLILFVTACLGINVKYSALLLFGMFGLFFYTYWIYQWIRNSGWHAAIRKICKIAAFFTILILFSVLILGSTSYGTNTINYGNPFYYGESDTLSIVNNQLPYYFQNLSTGECFVYSIFSSSANNMQIEERTLSVSLPVLGNLVFDYPAAKPEFKLPFTCTVTECISYGSADSPRISGWGVMYSGLFLIGLLCAALTCFLARKRSENTAAVTILIFAGIILPGFVVPGLWWARYYMPMFFIPVFALVFLFVTANTFEDSGTKIFSGNGDRVIQFLALILCFLMLINLGPSVAYLAYNVVDSRTSFDQIAELSDISGSAKVEIYTKFYGEYFNLLDSGIPYSLYSGDVPAADMKQILYGTYYRARSDNISTYPPS